MCGIRHITHCDKLYNIYRHIMNPKSEAIIKEQQSQPEVLIKKNQTGFSIESTFCFT